MKRFLAILIAVSAMAIAQPTGHAAAPSTTDQAIVHVLNRVAFGPREGDVERVRALGIARYIDQQLHPERLRDEGVEERLAGLSTLQMSLQAIADDIERPLLEARRERKQADEGVQSQPMRPNDAQQRANSLVVELSEQKLVRAISSERQLQEVLVDFWFNHFNVDARKGRDRFLVTAYERDAIRPHVFGKFRDLLAATAKSPAMLFYLDNFMSADPNGPHPEAGPAPVLRGPFGRRRIVQTRQAQARQAQPQQNPNVRRGLNENYAREVMELHTLGVDGGYSQHDVTEVARAFTGWTIANPRQGVGFRFEPRIHDPG
jgi:uncharacterized protein (DUF1800 family)